MTQAVYMTILDFIESSQKQFAEFCGDETIAWANHNDFKSWLEERDKSDAKILYELKTRNEMLEKEADWLADVLSRDCGTGNICCCDFCGLPEDGRGSDCLKMTREKWRKAARNALRKPLREQGGLHPAGMGKRRIFRRAR